MAVSNLPLQDVPEESAIQQLLNRLKGRIRLYVLFEGIGLTLTFVGMVFWASLAVDRGLELPVIARQLCVVGFGAALTILAFRWILSRVFTKFTDRNMAVLLERRFNEFGDSLLTSVELAEHAQRDPYSPLMMASTKQLAADRSKDVRVGQIFNTWPLISAWFLTILLGSTITVFAMGNSRDMGTWYQRWIMLEDVAWPRAVLLEVITPEQLAQPDGVLKIARDQEQQLIVRARLNKELFPNAEFPKIATVQYQGRDTYITRNLDLRGENSGGYQDYELTFPPLSDDIEFDVVAGDARLRDLTIDVVESPFIAEMSLHCVYPEYMDRVDATLSASRSMLLPKGTEVTLVAKTNKQIVVDSSPGADTSSVTISYGEDRSESVPVMVSPSGEAMQMTFTVFEDMQIFFDLFDSDGIRSREPYVVSITAGPDEEPRLAIIKRGVGTLVTPQARIPWEGTISDDYGLTKIWYELSIDDQEPITRPFGQEVVLNTPQGEVLKDEVELEYAGFSGGTTTTEAFEIRDFEIKDPQNPDQEGKKLKPGQRVRIVVKARDNYDLEVPNEEGNMVREGPHTGEGDSYMLTIVTPQELREELETRELNLRQRFEKIVDKLRTRRRDLAKSFFPTEPEANSESTETEGTQPEGETTNDQPEDEPDEPRVSRSETLLLQAERSLQNSRESADETNGVAQGFEEIVEELINNRIDNPQLRQRLGEDVAIPLREIANEMFPKLDREIEALKQELRESPGEEVALDSAEKVLKTKDEILESMRRILNKMKEMEDMNAVIAMLREIMESQQTLIEETDKARQDQLTKDLEGFDLE